MDARSAIAARIQQSLDVTDEELISYLDVTDDVERLDIKYKKQLVSYAEQKNLTLPLAKYYFMQLTDDVEAKKAALKDFLNCFQIETKSSVNLSGISLVNADCRGLNFTKVKLTGISFSKNHFTGAAFIPADAFVSAEQFTASLNELQKNHAAGIWGNEEELNEYQHLLLDNILRAFVSIHTFHQKKIFLRLACDHPLFRETKPTVNKTMSVVAVMQQASPLLRRADVTSSLVASASSQYSLK